MAKAPLFRGGLIFFALFFKGINSVCWKKNMLFFSFICFQIPTLVWNEKNHKSFCCCCYKADCWMHLVYFMFKMGNKLSIGLKGLETQ